MKHFWDWVRNEDETRTLFLEGVIAEESWFDDEVSPAEFKQELFSGSGPITLHINSPGGDCIAASQIYTMLMDYPDDVNVQIDGMAASAASVIAMAGTKVCMSPTSMMMIHNPFTAAMGDSDEMRKAIQLLDEVKESIINAYEIKTGLSRTKLSHLMNEETWMNALKAKELGFCDEVLYTNNIDMPDEESGFSFARKTAAVALMNRVMAKLPRMEAKQKPEMDAVPVAEAEPVSASEPDPIPDHEPALESSNDLELNTPCPSPCHIPDNRVKAADLEKRLSLLQ